MSRSNPWNPLRRNNSLTGGNPEKNWLTRVHRDTPQPDPENTRPSAPDFLKLRARDDSDLHRFVRTAGKFVRKAAEWSALGQISLADQMLFHDWLHPDGKNLDLNRATYLAMQEQQYYRQNPVQKVEEAEMHFLKSFIEKLSKIGDSVGRHKHKPNRKGEINENEEVLEAYEAGKQEGEEEAYYRNKHYRDIYYRNKEKLENDPKNDPLG